MGGFVLFAIFIGAIIYFYLKQENPKAIDSIKVGTATALCTSFGCVFKLVFAIIAIYLAYLFFSWIGATGIIILLLILLLFK